LSDVSQQLIAVLTSLVTALQALSVPVPNAPITSNPSIIQNQQELSVLVDREVKISVDDFGIRSVPFYSQFTDITNPAWKKVSCGIAGVAMLIDYYAPAVSADELLERGIASGAFLDDVGWTHAGLINLTKKYGLGGSSRDMAGWSMDEAFSQLETVVAEGPVMVSVYYTFVPGHPIPHLVVVNDIDGDTVYYNDPADMEGGGAISIDKFKPAWKKRYIEIRPEVS
jgi:hypothetical protein